MRRIGRILLHVATMLSLLIFLAGVGLWVRSYWTMDGIIWRDIPQDLSYFDQTILVSCKGGVMRQRMFGHWKFFAGYIRRGRSFEWYSGAAGKEYPFFHDSRLDADDAAEVHGGAMLGFEFKNETVTYNERFLSHTTSMTFPLAAVVAITAILPIRFIAVARRRRTRRRREDRGLCAVCGYDLRATPARCPECGAVGGVGPGDLA